MLAPLRDTQDQGSVSISREPITRLVRMVGPIAGYRTKDDVEPVMPLPRWTSWAVVAWMVGTVATYSIILARWWE